MSKVLVNVHGAGKQMSDFYKEALNALAGILGAEPACLPVWYAQLSNIGSPVRGRRPESSPEALEFRAALTEEILQRQQEWEREQQTRKSRRKSSPRRGTRSGSTARNTVPSSRGLIDIAAVGADLVSDVVRYTFDAKLQKAVKERLHAALEQAAKDYDETILVSHSLGTVVAFDALRERADRYNVVRFVTMGSPLRKLVTLGRRSSDLGAINRATLPFWRNLYDTTDPVADAIGPAFPGYLIEDVFVQVADAPVPSHDYWRNAQVLNMLSEWLR